MNTTALKPQPECLLYQNEDGQVKLETCFDGQTIWLSIRQMADLFGLDKSGISRHLKKIFATGELTRESAAAVFTADQNEGRRTVTRKMEYFNLEAVMAVGYRVNSLRGTQFRTWATQKLKEYFIKGFFINEDRLKNFDSRDYFDELLERIR